MESTLGSHIEIESDANVAALAETLLGSGKTHNINSLCFLTLGSGVGSGLILDGEIWHGSTGIGGEAGHLVIEDQEGAPCGCGGSGCLEQYASATAIVRMARERIEGTTSIDSHEVALLARERHSQAISVFEAVGHALAIGFTDLINCLNLPLYLVGCGISKTWDLFSPFMFRELQRRSYVYRLTRPEAINPEQLERHKTYILKAQLGSAAGLLRACLLPLQQHINSGY